MVPLSSIDYFSLRIGDVVISAIGNTGHIVDLPLETEYVEWDLDRYLVTIEWENSYKTVSSLPHYLCDRIEYIGENKNDRC